MTIYHSKGAENKWWQYVDNRMYVVDFFQDKDIELQKYLREGCIKFLRRNLYLGARYKRKAFFNDTKEKAKRFEQAYYAIGFDNSLKRLFYTNYYLYSSFLGVRSFVYKIVKLIIRH